MTTDPIPSELANGQTLRLPGSSRQAALHDQLYRYAEDLEQSIVHCNALEQQNKALQETCAWLEESRRQFDDLMRGSRDMHIITDLIGTILHCNPATFAMAPLQRLAGDNLGDWVLPSYRESFHNQRRNASTETAQPDQECEYHLRHASNDTFPLIVSARLVTLYKNGQAHGLHWVMRNITYLRESEFETQIATTVFKSTAEGVMITDADGEIMAVNPAFSQITGYSADEAIGRNVSFLRSGIQDDEFYSNFWLSLREKGSWQGELFNRKKSGEMYPEWLTISAARDGDRRTLSYVAIFSDISRLMRAEKRLAYLAHYDTLTGLPNRHLFQDRLSQALANARRSENPFTLIFIDLDKFKQINDINGHQAGDQVLQVVGKRLAAAVREIDTVARLGGDEFVVIAPTLRGAANIGRLCNKLIEAVIQPISFGGHDLHVGASLGCAEYPCLGCETSACRKCSDYPCEEIEESILLRNADRAMYQAKKTGGNSYVLHMASETPPVSPS
jgi:diguanylate cyclase (GGDEF)-like protein/PAS domain S-box-containing protein